MLRPINDIEAFEHKVIKLYDEVNKTRYDLFDIDLVGEKIGLNKDEIESMHYHLKRSDMIEHTDGTLLKISKYGHMMLNGQISQGYAPI